MPPSNPKKCNVRRKTLTGSKLPIYSKEPAITQQQTQHQAALAHLGERQTEVHFGSLIWRHCVRSTEAAFCELRSTLTDPSFLFSLEFFSSFFPLRIYCNHTLRIRYGAWLPTYGERIS